MSLSFRAINNFNRSVLKKKFCKIGSKIKKHARQKIFDTGLVVIVSSKGHLFRTNFSLKFQNDENASR